MVLQMARFCVFLTGALVAGGCASSQSSIAEPVGIPKTANGIGALRSCPTATCIYVTNNPSGTIDHGSVTVFPANATGNVRPYRTITGQQTGLTFPSGIAVDSRANIYVSITPPVQPSSLPVFGATANGDAAPLRLVAGPATHLERAHSIALDPEANVYVMNARDTHRCITSGCVSKGYVTVYVAGSDGNVAPMRFIRGRKTRMVGSPGYIAVDGAGNVYATNRRHCLNQGCWGENEILVFDRGLHGNSPPSWVIAGAKTGLYDPTGIAVDAAGNVYVANPDYSHPQSDSVLVYAAGEHGDVAPVRTISGSDTGLNAPARVAVDAAGRIYAANEGFPRSITVYAAGATGNVAPIQTISGKKTGLGPSAITIH